MTGRTVVRSPSGLYEVFSELDTTDNAAARTHDQADDSPRVLLLVQLGSSTGQRFALGTELVIGREADCGAILDDDGVSRKHARVSRSPQGEIIVEDLGSRNGTFVNGESVKRRAVTFGDKIALGAETLLLVTRHDAYEEQLRQGQKLQALGQLASGISHDFNNILGVLLANVTYLATKEHDDETVNSLADMQAAVHRAVDLTKQLSAFGRRSAADHRAVCLRSLTTECARLLRRTLPSNIGLQVNVPADLMVLGDASRLSQVLMNLCINAKDAIQGGGTIKISADSPKRKSTKKIVLRVSDTGCGIDPATRERLFEPFFTTKPRGKGTGLGLATVQTIVHEHRGEIDVDSEVGRGTTFSIRLPRLRVLRAGVTTLDRGIDPAPDRICGAVLLADDDELIRAVGERVITAKGGRAILAEDGAEALRLYTEHADEIVAVVLDLDMPNVDGEAVLRVLRSFNPELPILISSGHHDPEREQALRAGGATAILPKPFDAASLVQAVSRVQQAALR